MIKIKYKKTHSQWYVDMLCAFESREHPIQTLKHMTSKGITLRLTYLVGLYLCWKGEFLDKKLTSLFLLNNEC